MAYQHILYDVADGVATITLNHPETYNALTQAVLEECNVVLGQLNHDDTIRAVVLTGAGKGFCSGADLAAASADPNFDIARLLRTGLNVSVTQMRTLNKPVIGVINGVAAGAGASLALAADYRLASDKASFVFAAFVNIGVIPDAGLTYFLPRLVGVGKALELVLFADAKNRVDAQQALELGLVNRVVAHDDLLSEARALAVKLAQMPTKAIGWMKQTFYQAGEQSLAEALECEARLQGMAFRTRDCQEGVAAFLEKRPPVFKGN